MKAPLLLAGGPSPQTSSQEKEHQEASAPSLYTSTAQTPCTTSAFLHTRLLHEKEKAQMFTSHRSRAVRPKAHCTKPIILLPPNTAKPLRYFQTWIISSFCCSSWWFHLIHLVTLISLNVCFLYRLLATENLKQSAEVDAFTDHFISCEFISKGAGNFNEVGN